MSSSPRSVHSGHDSSPTQYHSSSRDGDAEVTARRSPTISRPFNPIDPDAGERQPTLDVDMALHLSHAHQGSVSVSPVASPLRLSDPVLLPPRQTWHTTWPKPTNLAFSALSAALNTISTAPCHFISAIHSWQLFEFEDFAKAEAPWPEKKRIGLLNSPSDECSHVLRIRKCNATTARSQGLDKSVEYD
ncbi:hypothetical protein EDB87DRAFT_1767499, partial [Lactarius vividus]